MLKLNVTLQYFALMFCVFDAMGSNPGAEIYYPLLGAIKILLIRAM